MRISDWSSDVCSSDLGHALIADLISDAGDGFTHLQPRRRFLQSGLLPPDRQAESGLKPEIAGQRPPAHADEAGPFVDRAIVRRIGEDRMTDGHQAGIARRDDGFFRSDVGAEFEIGRAHVWTPVTYAPLVCRLLLEKKKHKPHTCTV